MGLQNFDNYWHIKDFHYGLPESLVTYKPSIDFENTRLMVLDRFTGNIEHKNVSDLSNYFNAGDCVVLNDTKIIPSLLIGMTENNHSPIEIYLISQLHRDIWEVLVKPSSRVPIGIDILFGNRDLRGTIKEITSCGHRIIQFSDYFGSLSEVFQTLQKMTVPMYINAELKSSAKTIYSESNSMVLSDNKCLLINNRVLGEMRNKDMQLTNIQLQMDTKAILQKPNTIDINHAMSALMHQDHYSMRPETANCINQAKYKDKNVVAVGYQIGRILECVASHGTGILRPHDGISDIFIYPPYQFKIISKLITNFHLPQSLELMMSCAFSGYKYVMNAYREAVNKKYRFGNFGDLILFK